MRSKPPVPAITVERLPIYLRVLEELSDGGELRVNSDQLAELTGINAAKMRKDLSHLGSFGHRGVGYDVGQLRFHIARAMGIGEPVPVVIVGLGNLGRALAGYLSSGDSGFVVSAVFDANPRLVGTRSGGIEVRSTNSIVAYCKRHQISIGVIATPSAAAQDVVDLLVAGGVGSVLNFAPVVLDVPPTVVVRPVDLAGELQVLSFHEHQRA